MDIKANKPGELDAYKVNARDRNYQIWERNSLPVPLYTRDVITQKLNYIHNNPLQEHWRLAETPEAYHYSSAKFYLENDVTWDFLSSVYDE